MRSIVRSSASLALLALSATFGSGAAAQELRVRATDALGKPAIGALVTLLDPDSGPAASAVIGLLGRARLVAPPGRYRILVQAPGWADTLLAAREIDATTLDSLSTSLTGRRAALPTRLVTRPDRCDTPGLPASLASAWQEITKTLTVVSRTEALHLADLSLATFQRELSTSLKVEGETINTILAPSNRPDRAAEPGQPFAVRLPDSVRWTVASSALFLSAEFPRTHCFGLVNGTDTRLGMVGLEFAPVADTAIGIAGTMWLDVPRSELRVIEYRFTNLPRDWRADRAGGAIEINRMEPGFWVTRFWYQRAPELRLADGGRGRDRLSGYREVGAEVTGLVPAIDTTDRVAAAVVIARREAEIRSRVARIEGTVVDTLGYPISDAEVAVLGTTRETTTSGDGRFTLDGLPLGQQIVRVRKIGYDVRYFGIRLAGGQSWDGKVALARQPQVLGEILVTGRYGKPARYSATTKYDEFYRRRASAAGRFLTREDIDKSAAGRISELLRAIPGVRVAFATPGVSEEVSFLNCPSANVSVWIDGQRLSGFVEELLPLISPLDVEAVEVYQRESIIPPQFRDNACAAIVLWTR